jgi:SAM-dependent methyltransferase
MSRPAAEETSDRLRAALEGDQPDIGTLWEFCVHREWDRGAVVDGIAEWLGPPERVRVLDCACGSGFPAFDLIQCGYDVTCSDGSALMLEHFRDNARGAGLAVEPYQLLWDELSAQFAGAFDVVMCRGGGSLIYAGTWDEDLPPNRDAVTSAVRNFHDCLRPGGRLYVDTTRAEDLAHTEPQRTRHAPLFVDGRSIELEEEITNYPELGIRVWRSRLRIDGTSYEFARRSHYFSHPDFVGLLTETGFVDVHPEAVRGETYAVFVGTRPTPGPSLERVFSDATIAPTATRPATPHPHQGSSGAIE